MCSTCVDTSTNCLTCKDNRITTPTCGCPSGYYETYESTCPRNYFLLFIIYNVLIKYSYSLII